MHYTSGYVYCTCLPLVSSHLYLTISSPSFERSKFFFTLKNKLADSLKRKCFFLIPGLMYRHAMPDILDADRSGSQVHGQPGLKNKFKACLSN